MHEAQIGLDRNGRPSEAGVEIRHEGLEERRVVQEGVYARKPRRKAAELVSEH